MPDSIKEIQEAELKVKLMIENAKKSSETKISDAKLKARKMVDDAESESISETTAFLNNKDKELAQIRKKKLDEVHKAAIKIKKTNLKKEKLQKLAEHAVKEILGA
jgi:vacuolar-type H+-ATPase subunit H